MESMNNVEKTLIHISIFCLGCNECNYDLHLHCVAIPHQVNHHSHHHQLALAYKNPYPSGKVFICSSCKKYLDLDKWFYLCAICDFGGHVGCFSSDKLEVLSPSLPEQHHINPHGATQVGNETVDLLELQAELMRAQVQNMNSNMLANTMINTGHILSSLLDNVRYERRWI